MNEAEGRALAAEIERTLPEWTVRVERSLNVLEWAVLIKRSPDPLETYFVNRGGWDPWLHRRGLVAVAA